MERLSLFISAFLVLFVPAGEAGIMAGAAQRDITPPVGLEIQHYFRQSIGVHDSLYARCLYLEDGEKNAVAIVSLDLIMGGFDTCDYLREEILKQTGIKESLIAFSHSHSSAALGPHGDTKVGNDTGSKWNNRTLEMIIEVVKEAKGRAEPVRLRTGRANAQVGFNRRLVNPKNGSVYMGVNREGPVVPWVNVLVADSRKTGKAIAVLFEHAAHPVIVPHTSKLTSADFPGAAVERIRGKFGKEVIALFGQGCAGNINGFPLRSTHEKAEHAGHNLGDAVIKAIADSVPVKAETLIIKHARSELPSRALPGREEWQKMVEGSARDAGRMRQLNRIKALMDQGKQPPARRFDAYAVMVGNEWCLTTMPHEMFCQYELWIDKHAPFRHTMTFAFTNGYEGYVANDAALKMGAKGGYEAASLPNWGGQVWTQHLGPPAVGCEKIIQDTLMSLWPKSKGSKDSVDAAIFKLEYKRKGPHGGAREISVTENEGRVIFDITDKFGIGGGSISLCKGKWPAEVLIRMHLAGLEGFGVSVDDKLLSDKDLDVRMLDAKGRLLKGRYLKKSIDGDSVRRIAGYYEVEVPQESLVEEAKKIDLSWVDFYRR
jgi:neutral ceramidase